MESAAYVRAIRRESERLVLAAEAAGLDVAVPSCPGWTVSELLGHVGRAHRWSLATIERGDGEMAVVDELEQPPEPAGRVAWVRAGATRLADVIEATDPDTDVGTFTGPGRTRFWSRREAHETAVHRVDAQLAAGAVEPIDAGLAADGIDEFLWLLPLRPGTEGVTGTGEMMRIHCTDGGERGMADEWDDGQWLVRLDPAGLAVARGNGPADVTVQGPASDVFLVLTGRLAPDSVEVLGDVAGFDRFLAQAAF